MGLFSQSLIGKIFFAKLKLIRKQYKFSGKIIYQRQVFDTNLYHDILYSEAYNTMNMVQTVTKLIDYIYVFRQRMKYKEFFIVLCRCVHSHQ